jgi:hypothetical protein
MSDTLNLNQLTREVELVRAERQACAAAVCESCWASPCLERPARQLRAPGGAAVCGFGDLGARTPMLTVRTTQVDRACGPVPVILGLLQAQLRPFVEELGQSDAFGCCSGLGISVQISRHHELEGLGIAHHMFSNGIIAQEDTDYLKDPIPVFP